jgi:hypothetical protein
MSSSSPASTTDVVIDGLTIKKLSTAAAAPPSVAVHSKTSRAGLDETERVRLFRSATQRSTQGIFKPLPIAITDPRQLTDYSSMDTLIKTARDHCKIYDMADVFTIVFPDPASPGSLIQENGSVKTRNLFTDYATISVPEVAASNAFYHAYTTDNVDQLHTNLQWTYYYFSNNIENDLSHRLQQKYDHFTSLQQGGPLLFILLLQDLLLSTESSLKGLQDQLKLYRIDKIAGENIKTVSTIVLSIANRIWYSNKQNFPSGFIDTIIKLYQSSSVLSFNEQFRTIANTRASEQAAAKIASQTGASIPPSTINNDLTSVQLLTGMADQFYDQYQQDGSWNLSVKTKPFPHTDSQGRVNATPLVCFNCNGPHHVRDCPKPLDKETVTQNRQIHRKERKNSSRPDKTNPSTFQWLATISMERLNKPMGHSILLREQRKCSSILDAYFHGPIYQFDRHYYHSCNPR